MLPSQQQDSSVRAAERLVAPVANHGTRARIEEARHIDKTLNEKECIVKQIGEESKVADLVSVLKNDLDIDENIQFGRLVVMLCIACPCAGKTTIFNQLRKFYANSKSVEFVDTGDIAKAKDSLDNECVKLVILVKSSDEYSARMIREHHANADAENRDRESEDEIRSKTHTGNYLTSICVCSLAEMFHSRYRLLERARF